MRLPRCFLHRLAWVGGNPLARQFFFSASTMSTTQPSASATASTSADFSINAVGLKLPEVWADKQIESGLLTTRLSLPSEISFLAFLSFITASEL